MEEICYGLSARIVGMEQVRFIGVWEMEPGKKLAAFQSLATGTTLAIRTEHFSTTALLRRLRESNKEFGISDDGPEAA
jgi:hypothetical protein